MSKTVFSSVGKFTSMARIISEYLEPFARATLHDVWDTSPNIRVAVVRACKVAPPPADPAWNMDPEEYEYLWWDVINTYCMDLILANESGPRGT